MKLRTWLKRSLLTLGILATPFLLLAAAFVWRFIPFPPEPDYPPPGDRAEAYRQDLDYLRLYPDYDRSFSPAEKLAFQAALGDIEARVESLSPAGFELAVARAVALADNGHTNVSPIRRRARVNALPLRMAWFSDGLYVVQARDDHTDLLGAKVMALEGHSPAAAAERFDDSFGGHPGRARWISVLNLESPDLMNAAGIGPSAESLTLELRLPDGRQTTRSIAAIAPFEERDMRRFGGRLLAYDVPEPARGSWRHVMANASPPRYLADPGLPFTAAAIEHSTGRGLYLRLDMTMDINGFVLVEFQEAVLASVDEDPPEFLVVDLRRNGGGTIEDWFSRELVARLPADAPVFVITSPETFSGGIAEAAYFKFFGGERAFVVGEPVGDRLIFWANGGDPMVLPNSGIPVAVWVSKEDWENGCDDWRECFWPTMLEDVGVGTLTPDLPVSLSFAQYAAGRDPAMETILATLDRLTQMADGGSQTPEPMSTQPVPAD